jgi:hypothetical protein
METMGMQQIAMTPKRPHVLEVTVISLLGFQGKQQGYEAEQPEQLVVPDLIQQESCRRGIPTCLLGKVGTIVRAAGPSMVEGEKAVQSLIH